MCVMLFCTYHLFKCDFPCSNWKRILNFVYNILWQSGRNLEIKVVFCSKKDFVSRQLFLVRLCVIKHAASRNWKLYKK